MPTAKGAGKPSIEFASLLQGLLMKEPSKRYISTKEICLINREFSHFCRLDWPAVLTHPFWTGKLTHLVRPQTGTTKKSVNHNETQGKTLKKKHSPHLCEHLDRPVLSSRLATTDRPESNVSFSLRYFLFLFLSLKQRFFVLLFSCTKTSIQISQVNKNDETNGHKPSTNDHSSINTHEQSTASIGSETNERLRKMFFSKAELRPTSIIENSKIQKTLPFKFETKLLPFQLGKCMSHTRLHTFKEKSHVFQLKF